MGLRINIFDIVGNSLKNPILVGSEGGVPEKPIYREELLKKGGLGQFPDLGGVGGLGKKKGVVFLKGVDALI